MMLRFVALLLLLTLIGRLGPQLMAQNASIDSLRTVLKTAKDTTRVMTLVRLCDELRSSRPKEALKMGEEAMQLAQHQKFPKGEASALVSMGIIYKNMGHYARALKYYQRSLKLSEQLEDLRGQTSCLSNIGVIYAVQGQYGQALLYFQRSLKLDEKQGDRSGIANNFNNIGLLYQNQGRYDLALEYLQRTLKLEEELGNLIGQANSLNNIGNNYLYQELFDRALEYYQRSLKLFEQTGYIQSQAAILGNIGNIYLHQKWYDRALDYYQRSLKLREQLSDLNGQALVLGNIGLIYHDLEIYDRALGYLHRSLDMADSIGTPNIAIGALNNLALTYKQLGDFRNAYLYRTELVGLKDTLFSLEKTKAIQEMETKYQTEKKELQIRQQKTDLMIKDQRNEFLMGVGGILGLLLIIVGYGYYDKRRTSRLLAQQKQQIEQAFEEIRVQNEQLEEANRVIGQEKQRSDDLLHNILPHETAEELKATGQATPKRYEQVSVLFTDFKGFTSSAEKMTPEEVVSQLDTCFKAFDRIVKNHGLEKIKTIGDAYMCAGGLPVENPENAERMIQAGLEMQRFMTQWKAEREADGKTTWECRLGIHSGPVVAGVVGESKFAYDIWGDTVNTASRMESSGEVGKVNISETTYQLVKDKIKCVYRGELEAKGKGKIGMYFVEG